MVDYATVQSDECPNRTARPERPFPDGPAAARLQWVQKHNSPGQLTLFAKHTFDEYVSDREAVREKFLELVTAVGLRFRREKRWARTARLKLRDADFETFTRQMQFTHPERDDFTFREAALALFDREWPKGSSKYTMRLVGFGVVNLQDYPEDSEPMLFADPVDESRKKRERLSETLDTLMERGLLK